MYILTDFADRHIVTYFILRKYFRFLESVRDELAGIYPSTLTNVRFVEED